MIPVFFFCKKILEQIFSLVAKILTLHVRVPGCEIQLWLLTPQLPVFLSWEMAKDGSSA